MSIACLTEEWEKLRNLISSYNTWYIISYFLLTNFLQILASNNNKHKVYKHILYKCVAQMKYSLKHKYKVNGSYLLKDSHWWKMLSIMIMISCPASDIYHSTS